MTEQRKQRLDYIDWARGLACLGMFEIHCYDSWLGDSARNSSVYGWSQFSGSLVAPLFIFLAGVACVLVSNRMRRKNATTKAIAIRLIRRGAEIYGLGLLFRAQEFVSGTPVAPWTDLFRVDVLNLIGLSIIFIGILFWIVQGQTASAIAAAGVALAIALATPLLWTTWQPDWLPWYVESYINGVHTYNIPQAWLFPIFPWMGFAFAGLAVGYVLFSDRLAKNPARTATFLGAGGAAICLLSLGLEALPLKLYPVHDYWHTSPNFFLIRIGVVLITIGIAFAWCQWGPGAKGFSPVIKLGQASLLVYWVHNDLVYGHWSILPRHQQGIATATLGLLVISAAMVALATARVRWKGRSAEILARFRGATRTAAEG